MVDARRCFHELERSARGPFGQPIKKGFLVHIRFNGDAVFFKSFRGEANMPWEAIGKEQGAILIL